MISVHIIQIGEPKNSSMQTLANEYIKRLSLGIRLKEKVLKESKFTGLGDRDRVLSEEAIHVTRACKDGDFNVLLTENGKTFSSVGFSTQLSKWSENGQRTINFIIGGPLGIERDLLPQVHETLSLSPMTFPHELARLLLLEQLYRATTIIAGKTYHY